MNWTPEDVMAYADGEMPVASRDAFERDLAADDTLRRRVDALRAQRQRVEEAYAEVMDEPVPDRLSALLKAPAPVVSLAAAREHRAAGRRVVDDGRRHVGWAAWGGMAACLVMGLWAGMRLATDDAPVSERDGRLVAAGSLSRALTSGLAVDGPGATVHTPISFVDRQGRYCRAFRTATLAGLACREGERWDVVSLAPDEPAVSSGALRQAASALPASVLEAIDRRIDGAALDAQAERRARDRGWKR